MNTGSIGKLFRALYFAFCLSAISTISYMPWFGFFDIIKAFQNDTLFEVYVLALTFVLWIPIVFLRSSVVKTVIDAIWLIVHLCDITRLYTSGINDIEAKRFTVSAFFAFAIALSCAMILITDVLNLPKKSLQECSRLRKLKAIGLTVQFVSVIVLFTLYLILPIFEFYPPLIIVCTLLAFSFVIPFVVFPAMLISLVMENTKIKLYLNVMLLVALIGEVVYFSITGEFFMMITDLILLIPTAASLFICCRYFKLSDEEDTCEEKGDDINDTK